MKDFSTSMNFFVFYQNIGKGKMKKFQEFLQTKPGHWQITRNLDEQWIKITFTENYQILEIY